MTLPYLSDALAQQHGDAPAVADERTALTFAELDARASAVAGRLAAEGFGRGDVLAVMLPNRVELVVCLFAAWRLGGTATPVNPAFTEVEATHQVADSGATLIVVESDDAPTGGARPLTVASLATATPTGAAPVDVSPDDLALLVYTSGSTGRPKGVMLSHANVDAMSATMARHMELTADDHCMLILPLFHVNAVMVSLLAPLRVGGRLTIIGRFSPQTFFGEVERLRPTYFSAVPTIYALLAALPEEVRPDTSSLRFVVCGAAPVSQELLAACERRFGFVMVEGYGLTEGTCASACNPVGPDAVRKLGTVGPALPGQCIAIAGPDGEHLPPGETGEVLIAGPTVMQGYLNKPEATAETVVDGWLHTGDVGRLDEDGYLQLVDRIKDMIIRGGENLYPKEIENAIARIEGVLEVAVVGRHDDVLGEVPVAFVVAYPGAVLTEDDVLAHCRRELTRVKVPAAVDVVEALPKNPVGKIDKPTLRRLVRSA
ncbi:AMP-binding protein [Aeromicrobium tamlense]|uniref:AMP-binding protein n=1 Tax=Aeromicrobium tamlense TaxID=375541 RepID=A0A8I0FTU2_9ACTN|nr:AMP-binding protein [Aeromicrobium tamlense]MBD1270360.1 AMP-binding protein [Aeromicrobium tamlense]MBD1271508.1 AMP-binding protein [Aeromicrobium tamlense]NYI37746.1 acyl-CoA synthetase (AMP-forming)/AMP-acid ligase II [Aeromicrobium tamlense]